MKDKIVSFILILVMVSIIVALGVFGYTIYVEITGSDPISIDFEGYGSLFEEESNNSIPVNDTNEIFYGIDEENREIQQTESKYRHLYQQLNNTGKKIYDGLYENIENLKTGTYRISFGNEFQELLLKETGEAELKKQYQSAIEAFIYENPEVFYLDATKMYIYIEKITKLSGVKYNVYIDNGDKENYLIEGLNSKEEVDLYEQKIEKVKSYILSNLDGKSEYEKIKLVHDYLVDSIEYDSTVSKNNIYDIYGALVLRECVCEGYAKAFQYLMNEIGIKNVIVIGTGENSQGQTESHAWNYVELEGKWYAIDVTWDDPILVGNGIMPQGTKYKNFLKGSNTINKNHFPSGKFTEAGQIFEYPQLSLEDYE